jgi:hypothetical protein
MSLSPFAKYETLATLGVATFLPSHSVRSRGSPVRPHAPAVRSRSQASGEKSPSQTCRAETSESVDIGPTVVQRPAGAWAHCPGRLYGPGLRGRGCSHSYSTIREQEGDTPAYFWNLRDGHRASRARSRGLRIARFQSPSPTARPRTKQPSDPVSRPPAGKQLLVVDIPTSVDISTDTRMFSENRAPLSTKEVPVLHR